MRKIIEAYLNRIIAVFPEVESWQTNRIEEILCELEENSYIKGKVEGLGYKNTIDDFED